MRLKIIGANFLVVLVCGLAAFLLVRGSLSTFFSAEVEASLARDQSLFEDGRVVSAHRLGDIVRKRARIPGMAAVFDTPPGSDDRRRVAFDQADELSAALESEQLLGRRPELVAITDERGRIVARNVDINAHYGRDLGNQFPSIRFALNGEPITDIWMYDTQLLEIAASPIVRGGQVLGSLVVGFDISNGQAREQGMRFGKDISYFSKGRLYSSSLNRPGARQDSASPAQEMAKAVRPALATAVQTRSPSKVFPVTIGGSEYLAVVGPLPGQLHNHEVAYAIVSSKEQALAPVSTANTVLVCMILALIGVAVVGLLLSNHFLKPIEQIEDGVLRVINGDVNHRLEIESSEVGGLAYRINQLINTLTGIEEESEEGSSGEEGAAGPPAPAAAPPPRSAGGEWNEALSVSESPAAGAAADPGALAAEPVATYYARVFREYVDAKRKLGERVDNITQDKFVDKLRSNEQSLAAKYGVPQVRFQVMVSGNQVSLRPIPLS